MDNLNDYKHNKTSADGENGILSEIFRRLEIEHGTCVEFGAADGVWNSNTYFLWAENNWNAILIENNQEQFAKLSELANSFTDNKQNKIICINAFVSPYPERSGDEEGGVSFDELLLMTSEKAEQAYRFTVSKDFDFLSIDVDGNDYYVWDTIKEFKPKCVCIEYNQTVPPNIDYIDEIKPYLSGGAGIKPMVELGNNKGYQIVACTGSNLIFVRNDYVEKLGNITTRVRDLFDYDNLTCVVSTQEQDVVYLTKSRPANYYMTLEKINASYERNFSKEDYRSIPTPVQGRLYPVMINYSYHDVAKYRIVDGNLVTRYKDIMCIKDMNDVILDLVNETLNESETEN